MIRHCIHLALCCVAAIAAMPCFAQSDEDTLHLAELTVTAMKQVDNMASVPSAITVVGRDEASRNKIPSINF